MTDDFIKMDIFFTVATILVAIVGLLVAAALVLFIRLLRKLERIADDVGGEAKLLIADIDEARTKVRVEGFKLAHVLSLLSKTGKRLVTRALR